MDLLRPVGEVLLFAVTTSAKAHLVVAGTMFGSFGASLSNIALLLLLASPCLPMKERSRRWVLLVAAISLSALFFVDKVHYRAFHDFATAEELGHAGQLLDVFAGIFPYVRPFDLWWIADWPFWFFLLLKRPRATGEGEYDPRAQKMIRALVGLSFLAYGCCVFDYLVGRTEKRLVSNRGFAVKQAGLLNFHLFDTIDVALFSSKTSAVDESALAEAKRWFRQRDVADKELLPFGMARGCNLIFLQVESLEAFVVGLRVDDQEITPHLNRLATNSIFFRLFFPQNALGSTSDAEFCALNSLLPVRHGVVARNYADNTFRALPSILRDHHYDGMAMSVCRPNLWNMGQMHRAYGFRWRYYYEHFAEGSEPPLSIPDDRFLNRARAIFKKHRQPFFAHLMTISSHTPFTRFPREKKTLQLKQWNNTVLGNYLQSVHFVDHAIGGFLEGLRADGLLTNSVVVIYGDHQVLPDEDWQKASSLAADSAAIRIDEALRRRVPAFIVVPGGPAQTISDPAGQIDLAPTVLHLLGIPESEGFFIGRNLFRDSPPIVFFRNESFITETLIASRGIGAPTQCIRTDGKTEAEAPDCERLQRHVSDRISISDLVIENDLIRRLKK